MAKIKYTYLSDQHDFTSDVVADDYQLKANETFTAPADGIKLPVTFDGTNWSGATDDEYAAYLAKQIDPDAPTGPSDTDQALAALTLQVAQNKTDQDTATAKLLLEMAQQAAKGAA